MRALWVTGPGRVELRDEPDRTAGAGEALVRARYSGVSRGTEALVLAGRVPPALHTEMRAPFQAGEFPAPVKYGYASVGVVEGGPAALVGQRVFCLHPHQDRYVVPVTALTVVPEGVPSRRAVLAANLETAVNALWDGAPGVGDRIVVVGAGTVGLCVALLAARIPGVQLRVVDSSPARRELAVKVGLDARAPGDVRGECDLVVHASGSAAGLATALALAGLEATVLELSWYGAGDVPAPLGEAFHSRRLRLQASQVGQVAPSHRPRWTHARRLALALSLLADERFEALLSPAGAELPFAELPVRLPATLAAVNGAPTPVVLY
jgi:threonine dehydrogenase-like Zn-dependent dehydrogenase